MDLTTDCPIVALSYRVGMFSLTDCQKEIKRPITDRLLFFEIQSKRIIVSYYYVSTQVHNITVKIRQTNMIFTITIIKCFVTYK